MKYLAIIVGILVVLVPAFASNEVLVSSTEMPLIFNLVSSTDHVTPLTGATATVVISKNGASFGSPSGSVSEIGDGWYEVAANATDTGTKGVLIVHATATGADASDTRYLVVAYDPLTTGAGGVVTVGTGTGQLNPSSGTLTGVGLAATQTGVTIPTVTTVTNQLSAATVATATAADILVTPADLIATNGSNQVVSSSVQGNVTGSVGSVTGAVGSVTGAVGSVTGAVGSVTAQVTTTAIIQSGTATAGAAGSLTLANSASTTASLYIGDTLGITSGTGAGQARTITAYSTGRVAAVDWNWTVTPDNTSVYNVVGSDQAALNSSLQVAYSNAAPPAAAAIVTALFAANVDNGTGTVTFGNLQEAETAYILGKLTSNYTSNVISYFSQAGSGTAVISDAMTFDGSGRSTQRLPTFTP